jgi:hypothetical protein
MERIQVLLDPEEKERCRRLAQQRGLSLSAWLREAALTRATEEDRPARLRSRSALRAFFTECDAREAGPEPDWDEHLRVLETSKVEGAGTAASRGGTGTRGRREGVRRSSKGR